MFLLNHILIWIYVSSEMVAVTGDDYLGNKRFHRELSFQLLR